MSRFLFILGLVMITLGIFYPSLQKLGLGRLPGDLYIEKGHYAFYLPVTTSILLSILITLVVWIIGKFNS